MPVLLSKVRESSLPTNHHPSTTSTIHFWNIVAMDLLGLLHWPLRHPFWFGLLVIFLCVLWFSYPTIIEQAKLERETSQFQRHIERVMTKLLEKAHVHSHSRVPDRERCQQVNHLAIDYQIFEWYIHSCCIPLTEEKQKKTFRSLQPRVPYNKVIAKNLWDSNGEQYCKQLKFILELRKTSLIEFAQNLTLAPLDIDLSDAITQLMEEYKNLHGDIRNFHALGWARVAEDGTENPQTTCVETQAAELESLYKASVGIFLGSPSYADW
jgi:hypothetical protein